MDYYELFQQSPELAIFTIVVSIAITLLLYGAFPLIFAKARKTPITKKKYRRRCYGINIAIMFVFGIINGAFSGAPYLLWTWVFSRKGINILDSRGMLEDSDNIPASSNRVTICLSCGYRDKAYFDSCPKCGKKAKQYAYINDEMPNEPDKILFCRKCGTKLNDNSKFCWKCGTKIVEE